MYTIDLKELALKVAVDPDHRFDLALQLDDLDIALEILHSIPEEEAETKWKSVGDRALAVWRFDLARQCFDKAGDLSSLMLLLLSIGDRDGLKKLASQAGKCPAMLVGLGFSLNWNRRGERTKQFGVRRPPPDWRYARMRGSPRENRPSSRGSDIRSNLRTKVRYTF